MDSSNNLQVMSPNNLSHDTQRTPITTDIVMANAQVVIGGERSSGPSVSSMEGIGYSNIQLRSTISSLESEVSALHDQRSAIVTEAQNVFMTQRYKFETAAREYEQHCRDVNQLEVNQAEVVCHSNFTAAIQNVKSIANSEQETQRQSIYSEAELELARQRDHIISAAKRYLEHVHEKHNAYYRDWKESMDACCCQNSNLTALVQHLEQEVSQYKQQVFSGSQSDDVFRAEF